MIFPDDPPGARGRSAIRRFPSSLGTGGNGNEHQSECFAFGYVLYWLARSNRFQTGCFLRERRFFRNFYVSETSRAVLARMRILPRGSTFRIVLSRIAP